LTENLIKYAAKSAVASVQSVLSLEYQNYYRCLNNIQAWHIWYH